MADITKGLPGLTFASAISPSAGLAGRLQALREAGASYSDVYQDEPTRRFRRTMRDVDEEGELLSQMLNWRPSRNERVQSQRGFFLGGNPSEDIGLEAAAAGFGESRFDRKFTSPAQLDDIEDARAREQSTLGVYGNSFAKMGVLAATTAADSWIGLPAGVINLVVEGSSGNINSGKDFLNALVDNPVSSYLQGINEKSEDIFRNYQTSQERNRPWWENMFTANFIGDTLIKNAGFTIGAVVGAKGAVSAIGKMSGAKEARDAFKGLAAELGLAGKSASEVVELLAKGTTSLEKQAAVKALAESARRLKNAELGLQIAGGLLAGTGEARIEALNGASELEKQYEDIYGNIDLERAKALTRVRELMAQQGIDYNTPEGRAYFNEQKAVIDEKFVDLQEQIAHDKAMAANTIFALNVPLLTFGDVVQWGKVMLGGYAVDRKLVKGITKATESAALRGAAKLPEDVVKATRFAAKGTKFTDFLGKVGAGSRNVLVEMQEEMNQSLFSATAKAKAMGNTTEFMERLYDPMAVADTVSWLDAAKEGMRQSWLNKDDWVEGFAGGFMGFMGLPSISVKVNEKTGKKSPKITMEGGIWSPIREQTDLYERRNELIKNLNTRLSSPDFLNYYYGKIGNAHFDSIKEDAVKSGDKKAYERADHAQLINDAMMFERAGRMQDFIDIIDSFQNVSDEKLEEIKKLFPSSSDVQDMTTSGMRELVNNNVDRMKRQLDGYLKIADDIRVVYGNTMPDDQIAEMTWQTAHLDEIEYDLKQILSHPSTVSMLSAYRAENADSVSELSDYDIIASGGYDNWLKNKYKDKKDPTSKSELKEALDDAREARYDLKQRESYLSNIEELSQDPELIQKRMALRMKQQERQRQLLKTAQSMVLLASTDKLSEFVSAMDDMDENVSNDVLAFIKNQADSGNQVAKEFLEVRDIDSHLKKRIEEIGKKAGATDEEIKQAMDAWNYFKHNSDTEFELTSKHSASDVASSVAGEKAVNLLNGAVESVMKDLKIFGKVQKRDIQKKKTTTSESDEEGNTKFKTTGKTLTKKRYEDICEELRKNAGTNLFGVGAAIHRIDLDKGNFLFDGAPATGVIYIYFPDNKTHISKGKLATPVAFNSNGEEIAKEDVEKLTGPNGEEFTAWLLDVNFPAAGRRSYNIEAPGIAAKLVSRLPVDKKIAKKQKKDSKSGEGKDAGKKTNPHKFIAPNMDISMLGSDGQAVAEALKSLPEDSEVHFGMESEDGPIYILAGDSNMKIGTLPEEMEGGESYSGLAELKELIKAEFKESSDRKNADGMWISEKYVNHLREKQDSGFVTTEDNVPIDEIPGFDGIKEPVLMFVYNDKDGQKYLFSNDSVDIDSVQFRAGASNQIKPGFAYLLVPSGKKFIPVMLYTQNVNEETFDLKDPKNTASGFGKRVSDAIDKIADAVMNTNEKEKVRLFKLWAWNSSTESDINSLQGLLHFRAKGKSKVEFHIKETCKRTHPEWFTNDDVVMVINTHFEESGEDDPIMIYRGKTKKDGSEYTIREQIIDAMNSLEFETESGEIHRGPIAQISAAQFVDDAENLSDRIREFVDSKMLLTDVKDFDLSMPSYVLDYWSVSQGKFLRPSHPAVGGRSVGATITTKKTKGKGTEKIASMEIGGKDIKFNLSSGEAKIGSSKWFNPMTSTKSIDADIKELGFKDAKTFVRTMRALAIIADKYGDSTTGEGRIGDRILLKDFTAGKNAGFVLTDKGGRFMSASELAKFEDELKKVKSKKTGSKKANEAERVRKAKEEIEKKEEEKPDNPDEFLQEVDSDRRFKRAQVSRMETIHNVRQAIEHLKKHAPQYSEFLDRISDIGFYDDVLVELADLTGRRGSRGGTTTGTNTFKFNKNEGEFTNSIVIGRDSLGYQTLMHELVHAFTVVALRYDKNLYEDIKRQMNYLQDSIGAARLARELGGYEAAYAFENPYEFIAEFFSNPKLQKLAKEVKTPEEIESAKPSVFARIINFIADKLKSLFRKKSGSFYDDLKEKLYNVVDRQVELQETGKVVFKTQEEFKQSQRLAKGAKVDGVVFSSKISTVENDMDFKYVDGMDDRFDGVRELSHYGEQLDGNAGPAMLALSQLLNPNDELNSGRGWRRLLENDSVYVYSNGSSSTLIGVKEGDVFISVRALPVTSDGSFESLVKSVRNNSVPVIIGVNESDVDFYVGRGMRVVGGKSFDGQVFVANPAFTSADLYKLGTTYRPFAEVLDGDASFAALRRQRYSDAEWNKFSELERSHARKCIGI